MDEYPKCPVRDKTNTEESPITSLVPRFDPDPNTLLPYPKPHPNPPNSTLTYQIR